MAECVVLASGSGTNFGAIADAFATSDHAVTALVTDNPSAYALIRAEIRRIPTIVVNYGAGRADAERRLLSTLESLEPDLIVLAGFMKILPANLVDRFPRRIINIHPSILPDFPGTRAIERSYARTDGPMGITIHTVDHGVDTGPVIAQYRAERSGEETLEQMEERIHALEHRYYPEVIMRRLDLITAGTHTAGVV